MASEQRQFPFGEVEDLMRSPSGAPAEGHAVRDYFSTDEIFQRVAASADEEFGLSIRLLFLGGLAAGLSIGLSFYARAAVMAQTDSALVGNLLYPIGFLLIVIGRYQLFTENTLTPVTLVLTRIASVPMLLRNWAIVLFANVLGAIGLAFLLAYTPIFEADAFAEAIAIGEHALEASWDALFFKGVMAGWLVASMVWLVHAARDTMSRIVLVFFIMYMVPTADLYHCIIGICEAMFMFFNGLTTLPDAIFGFFLPVVLGNTVGGVFLVAILNFAQTRNNRFPDRDCNQLELTWREWLLEFHAGRPEPSEMTPEQLERAMTLQRDVDASYDHIHGQDDAEITLVQYGDYECPDSRHIYGIVQHIATKLDINYRYVYRHLPLGSHHPRAIPAAKAAEAAGVQGAFWQMHDKLFHHLENLQDRDLEAYAKEIGLDLPQFWSDYNSAVIQEKVASDRADALNNEIYSSMNIFINGQRYMADFNLDDIVEALKNRVQSVHVYE
ncbi:MAG: formate/nitrite transporter family protein [Phototrophicaceae bacterium]